MTVERQRFSILLKDSKTQTATLYVRGNDESMRKLINFEDSSETYNSIINFNHQKGLKSVVYASKTISKTEAEQYFTEYQAICRSTIDQAGKFVALARSMENNLEFQSIVGFKNRLHPDAYSTVELLQNMGINVHILSGDNHEHCQMTAHSLNLFSSTENQINFNFQNTEAGKTQLKKALEAIHSKMKDMGESPKKVSHRSPLSFSPRNALKVELTRTSSIVGAPLNNCKNLEISISGTAMAISMKDPYLKAHLKMIFEYSKSVVGYKLSPQQKGDIVGLFNSLEHKTLAVGDGFNDINMLQTANVGIQFYNKMMGYKFGDILVDNLLVIPTAMNQKARAWNHNLHMLIHNTFKYSMLLLLVNLLYQIFCGNTGAKVVSSGMVSLSMFFLIPVSTLFVFWTEDYMLTDTLKMPALYCEKNYVTKLIDFRVLLFHLLPESTIEALLVYVLPHMTLRGGLSSEGTLRLLGDLQHTVWILSFVPFTLRLLTCHGKTTLMIRLGCLFTWTMMIASLIFLFEVDLLQRMDRQSFYSYFSANNFAILLVLGMTLYCVQVGYWSIFSFPRYFPVLNFISRGLQAKNPGVKKLLWRDSSDNFLQKFKNSDTFTTSFKKCFDNNIEVNPILTSLLSPASGVAEEGSLKFPLKFSSSILNKKYIIFLTNKLEKMMKLLLGIGSIGLGLHLALQYVIDRRQNDQIGWVFFFTFLIPSLSFASIMIFTWAKKVNTYNGMFHTSLLLGAVLFCVAQETDFTLLGTNLLLFAGVCFQTEFLQLFMLAFFNAGGFALCLALTGGDIGGSKAPIPLVASVVAIYLGVVCSILLMRWHIEKLLKSEFITGARLDSTAAIAKDLLSLLLPKFVLDRMQNFFEVSETSTVFTNETEVTVLFCDIADFDEVVRRNEKDIVALLDRIFRKFDDLCVLHGIQKIETVGKTYMAAGGLDAVESLISRDLKKLNPTLRTLNLAKDMMDHIKEYEGLNLKIGIHVGRPVIGVIGYHKPQFSLIGDVVNTTSRHCTTGKVGRIMMSLEAWDLVKSSSALSKGYAHEAVPTDMKGKGRVLVHHLFAKKNQFYSLIQQIVVKSDKDIRNKDSKHQKKVLSNLLNKIAIAKKSQNSAGGRFAQLVKQILPSNYAVFHQIRNNIEATTGSKATQTQLKPQGDARTINDIHINEEKGVLYHKVDMAEADEEQGEAEVGKFMTNRTKCLFPIGFSLSLHPSMN